MTCDEFRYTVELYVKLWCNVHVLFLYVACFGGSPSGEAPKICSIKKIKLNSSVNR
jgi:hypothetical protein